jgi:hypothetical protein
VKNFIDRMVLGLLTLGLIAGFEYGVYRLALDMLADMSKLTQVDQRLLLAVCASALALWGPKLIIDVLWGGSVSAAARGVAGGAAGGTGGGAMPTYRGAPLGQPVSLDDERRARS